MIPRDTEADMVTAGYGSLHWEQGTGTWEMWAVAGYTGNRNTGNVANSSRSGQCSTRESKA